MSMLDIKKRSKNTTTIDLILIEICGTLNVIKINAIQAQKQMNYQQFYNIY